MLQQQNQTMAYQSGLCPGKADACLFIRKCSTSVIILSVHVDDRQILSNHHKELNEFKGSLNTAFKCADGGPAS